MRARKGILNKIYSVSKNKKFTGQYDKIEEPHKKISLTLRKA